MVYCCESLEHAINMEGGMKEIYRVAKQNSIIVIIDKPIKNLINCHYTCGNNGLIVILCEILQIIMI